MEKLEIIVKAVELVKSAMKGSDASHDAAHALRVRDLALSLAREEGLASFPDSLLTVELAALLHDIGDYKYMRLSEVKIVYDFLVKEHVDENIKTMTISIINGMEFKVVQDVDRLDAIVAIGIARCFTFGGHKNRVLHDPKIRPRSDLSKEKYMDKDDQTTVNHFHEKLLKLKDLMKTKAGRKPSERRHKFMQEFLQEFYEGWDGGA